MNKLLSQGLIIVAFFGMLLAGFSQIDFMKLFRVKEATDKTEEKLGDLFWKAIQNSETVVQNDSVNKAVNKLITRIAQENHIDPKSLKVHLVEKDEINAFAMPNDHLVVYTGLIADCTNESELAGVLCHEMAHIQKNHVMKKLVKEVGLSVLISMTTGGKSPEMAKEAAKMLSSSAYDRTLESEADLTGVDYMMKAGLDPSKLADFLYRMGDKENYPDQFYWVSTHPESKARARAIIAYLKDKKFVKKPILTADEWKLLKSKFRKNKEAEHQ